MEKNSSENQKIKGMFVEREVIACASTLVWELSRKAEEFPKYTDDIYNAYSGLPDYEEAAVDHGWRENETGGFTEKHSGEVSEAETWQELCEEQNIDANEYVSEIFEHWIVTDYLADKLEERRHRILRDFFGFTIWGRPTTGQAILLDSVISGICEEMEILSGQKNDWGRK